MNNKKKRQKKTERKNKWLEIIENLSSINNPNKWLKLIRANSTNQQHKPF